MFTDCPDCQRQFHINAGQISAAGGQVICGYCGRQFNALARLHDRPLTGLPGVAQERQASQDYSTDAAAEDDSGRFPVARGAAGEAAAGMTDSAETREESAYPPSGSVPAADKELDVDQVAAALFSENRPGPGRTSRVLWITGSALLLLIIALQLAWFNREVILARYPVLLPHAIKLCELAGCEVFGHRDPDAIRLVNRDVRDHPRYKDALLVNATMRNQSDYIQPYPNVRFLLYDTNGRQIAYRDFRPVDYLDDSIEVERGMQPGVPVHFVLEIAGPAEGAVSFEFAFF